MKIQQGEETERLWFVLDDKEKIIQVFYNKKKAAEYVKQKEKIKRMVKGITLKRVKN